MKKVNNSYFLTVEGETEKWYFEWLQRTINLSSDAQCKVKIDCPVQKDPLKRAKSLITIEKVEITHITDRESEESVHVKQFETTLSRMKMAEKSGKDIK